MVLNLSVHARLPVPVHGRRRRRGVVAYLRELRPLDGCLLLYDEIMELVSYPLVVRESGTITTTTRKGAGGYDMHK